MIQFLQEGSKVPQVITPSSSIKTDLVFCHYTSYLVLISTKVSLSSLRTQFISSANICWLSTLLSAFTNLHVTIGCYVVCRKSYSSTRSYSVEYLSLKFQCGGELRDYGSDQERAFRALLVIPMTLDFQEHMED